MEFDSSLQLSMIDDIATVSIHLSTLIRTCNLLLRSYEVMNVFTVHCVNQCKNVLFDAVSPGCLKSQNSTVSPIQ